MRRLVRWGIAGLLIVVSISYFVYGVQGALEAVAGLAAFAPQVLVLGLLVHFFGMTFRDQKVPFVHWFFLVSAFGIAILLFLVLVRWVQADRTPGPVPFMLGGALVYCLLVGWAQQRT